MCTIAGLYHHTYQIGLIHFVLFVIVMTNTLAYILAHSSLVLFVPTSVTTSTGTHQPHMFQTIGVHALLLPTTTQTTDDAHTHVDAHTRTGSDTPVQLAQQHHRIKKIHNH
jgi:hypothetical protein